MEVPSPSSQGIGKIDPVPQPCRTMRAGAAPAAASCLAGVQTVDRRTSACRPQVMD